MRKCARSSRPSARRCSDGLSTLTPIALAGGGGGKPGGRAHYHHGTIELVLVNSADSVANWGEQVRFSTSAPPRQFRAARRPQVLPGRRARLRRHNRLLRQLPVALDADLHAVLAVVDRRWTRTAHAVLYKLANTGSKTTLNSLSFHAYA